MIREIVHYCLHFAYPVGVAIYLCKKKWQLHSAIMLLTMLVDLDHLASTPIYDSKRCSIGHHFLHQPALFIVYFALCFASGNWRYVGLGLCLHMATDWIDCILMHAVG